MNIEKIVNDLLGTNTYIISNGSNAIIVDPGSDFEKIDIKIKTNNLNLIGVLLTHGHFDHCYSAYSFEKMSIPIFVANADKGKVLNDGDMSMFVANTFQSCKSVKVFNEAILNLGDFSIKVLQTPGHTLGSVSFLIDNNIFVGDLFFKNGVGRYDLYDGSEQLLVNSIKSICLLGDDINVYPGHGDNTTIKEVKKYLNIE